MLQNIIRLRCNIWSDVISENENIYGNIFTETVHRMWLIDFLKLEEIFCIPCDVVFAFELPYIVSTGMNWPKYSLFWMCTLFCFMESLFPKILLQCLRQMMAHASKVWGVRTLKPSHYLRTPVSLYPQHLDLPFSWPTTVIVIIPTTYDLVCKPTPPVTCPDQTLWSPKDGLLCLMSESLPSH